MTRSLSADSFRICLTAQTKQCLYKVSLVFLFFPYFNIMRVYYFFFPFGSEHGKAVCLDLLSVRLLSGGEAVYFHVRCSAPSTLLTLFGLVSLGEHLCLGSLPFLQRFIATEQISGGEHPKNKMPRLDRHRSKPGSLGHGGQKVGESGSEQTLFSAEHNRSPVYVTGNTSI